MSSIVTQKPSPVRTERLAHRLRRHARDELPVPFGRAVAASASGSSRNPTDEVIGANCSEVSVFMAMRTGWHPPTRAHPRPVHKGVRRAAGLLDMTRPDLTRRPRERTRFRVGPARLDSCPRPHLYRCGSARPVARCSRRPRQAVAQPTPLLVDPRSAMLAGHTTRRRRRSARAGWSATSPRLRRVGQAPPNAAVPPPRDLVNRRRGHPMTTPDRATTEVRTAGPAQCARRTIDRAGTTALHMRLRTPPDARRTSPRRVALYDPRRRERSPRPHRRSTIVEHPTTTVGDRCVTVVADRSRHTHLGGRQTVLSSCVKRRDLPWAKHPPDPRSGRCSPLGGRGKRCIRAPSWRTGPE